MCLCNAGSTIYWLKTEYLTDTAFEYEGLRTNTKIAAVVGGYFKNLYGLLNLDTSVFQKFSLSYLISEKTKWRNLLEIIGIQNQETVQKLKKIRLRQPVFFRRRIGLVIRGWCNGFMLRENLLVSLASSLPYRAIHSTWLLPEKNEKSCRTHK